MKYEYHLVTIKVYVKSLRFFLKNNRKFDFIIKDISSEDNIVFSDSIANTIPNLGFTSLLLNDKSALVVHEKNKLFNSKSLFEANKYNALEWIVIKNSAAISFFSTSDFTEWFKGSFYCNIYPNFDIHKKCFITTAHNPVLSYLLYSFKEKSKNFEA